MKPTENQFEILLSCRPMGVFSEGGPLGIRPPHLGADLGGGAGGADAPPQGFDPLPTQRVPPLILFQKSIFARPTLKFF